MEIGSEAAIGSADPPKATNGIDGRPNDAPTATEGRDAQQATASIGSQLANGDQSSKIRFLEARYIELLEQRIEALEAKIRTDSINTHGKAKDESEIVVDIEKIGDDFAGKNADSERKADTEPTGQDEKDTDSDKKESKLTEEAKKGTDSDKKAESKLTEEAKKDTDSGKKTGAEATEQDKKDEQKQPRIQYRESRYNAEGIREEKDVKEDKDVNQTQSTGEAKKEEGFKPSLMLMKRYGESGKYEDSYIEVRDSLNALIVFVLAHHPKCRHFKPELRSIYNSPYEPFVHSWEDFQDLISMDQEKSIWVELKKKLERPQQSHNRPKSSYESESFYELRDPQAMSATIEDLKILLAKVESSVELEEWFKTVRDSSQSAGTVTWDLLWTLFPPGELVLAKPCFKQPQLFVTYSAESRDRGEAAENKKEIWSLYCWTYDWDGTHFNRGFAVFDFERFKGEKQINTLPAYPLGYDRDADGVKAQLIDRGKRFCQYCLSSSSPVYEYNGAALARGEGFRKVSRNSYQSSYDSLADSYTAVYAPPREDSKAARRSNLNREQVIVDHKAYIEHGPTFRISPHMGDLELVEPEGSARCQCHRCEENHRLDDNQKASFDGKTARDVESFTDTHYMLLPSRVLGYWLIQKRWLELSVDQIKPLSDNLNDDSFNRLQMEETQKNLLRDLIRNHASGTGVDPTMQDLSEGKGTGLIILFHGPPGVGKTSTAESISKATGKPLLPVAVSDIGLDPAGIQSRLDVLFDLATSWKAVLLFDEADVFLESRSNNTAELGRNALVSVLLRSLEYYSGILILTTNRITSLDIAVQSRINLAIRYPELDDPQKRAIYEGFVKQLKHDNSDKAQLMKWIDELERDREPPFRNLNGRQIRNVLFSAASLAAGRNGDGRLGVYHVRQILRETKRFQEDVQRHTDAERRRAEVGVNIG
ncbi:MAG: hypothetical protein M1821_004473 [Bathelium mastoideum]|nr:MAG: hypothetical protein M1821_004473 [Bathelium mastoideum]